MRLTATPSSSFLSGRASAGDASYAGEKAYVYVPGEDPAAIGDWEQNMLFVAEISGDFHCRDGGIEAFLSEKAMRSSMWTGWIMSRI